MESGTTFTKINLYLVIAAAIIIPWLAVRKSIGDSPDGLSVLLEWSGLIALTVAMCWFRFGIPRWLGYLNAIVLCVLTARSIADSQKTSLLALTYPEYWWGFGSRILMATVFVALVVCGSIALLTWGITQGIGNRVSVVRRLERFISMSLIIWTLPSVLQPMDGWLNMGDSTEKALDELAGWTVGNVPGIHTSWISNSLLGLPLAPLSLVGGFGDEKVILVALYTNSLVVGIPLLLGFVISRVLPQIRKLSAFSLALITVSISGSPGNSSLFQELSFLARAFLPLALGALLIHALRCGTPIQLRSVVSLGFLTGLTLLNNFEYGVGAAVAALVTVVIFSPTVLLAIRLTRMFLIGSVLSVVAVTIPSLIRGGDWFSRRLGIWADVVGGDVTSHSNNAGSWPPAFGLPALCFMLGTAGAAIGFQALRSLQRHGYNRSAALGCLYFGVWVVASAPYFLNGGGAGSFRTQFLFIPFALLAFSIFGVAHTPILREARDQTWSRAKSTELVARVPVVLLCSLVLAAVMQVPNGLQEWQRVQTPNLQGKTEDEWSPQRLDWIQPAEVTVLANEFGGVSEVGWWFSYGNAMEALTGIENLLGVTGFETTRSSIQLSLACEPLVRSKKSFIISFDNMAERMQACGFPDVQALTSPNDDGLVVYKISRT